MSSELMRKILLVEDQVAVATAIADLLSSFGLHVDIVRTAGHVIEAVETFAPDVVLLDVQLPDGDGRDVFRQIRSRWPSMPIIFSSAHLRNLSEVGSAVDGRVRLLQKPYESDALLEAIAAVCA